MLFFWKALKLTMFKNISCFYSIMEDSQDFFKVFSNVPIEERNNVIVIIEGRPISWNLASIEIKNKTKRGEKILKTLKDLEII